MIINCRMIAFIGAAEQRNELALYAPLLGRLLPELPLHRAAEDAVVGHVFGAMERHHVDFSGTALSFVERDVFTSMSLLYLQTSAPPDAEIVRRLSTVTVRPDLQKRKNITIEVLKQRLAGH